MKPRIHKRNGTWIIQFSYRPRSFMLFGLSEPERQRVKEACVQEGTAESWSDAVACLRELYRRREIA